MLFKRFLSSGRTALVSDKSRFVPKSGTYPLGFKVGAVHCGVKKNNHDLDVTAVVSDTECNAAAVFTQNLFRAAPVVVSSEILAAEGGSNIRSVIVNSKNANAGTGENGMKNAWSMARATDKAIYGTAQKADEHKSLVMSTGVIGQQLPIDNILSGIQDLIPSKLGTSHEHWLAAAKGICTTDTFPKMVSTEFQIDGTTYRMAGFAKGAGMIHPNMATLLGIIATDAPVTVEALKTSLKYSVDRSFNSITVDGECSTNDTIAVLANGAAGGKPIDLNDKQRYAVFSQQLTDFAEYLAKLVVRDGEGATKFVTITVQDAESYEDAKQVGMTIANSNLVKTALYGNDANWGRILSAAGHAGVYFDTSRVNISFIPTDGSEELKLLINGEPTEVDETRATEILKLEDLEINIQLGSGRGQEARVYTCDLTAEYVHINGDYRT